MEHGRCSGRKRHGEDRQTAKKQKWNPSLSAEPGAPDEADTAVCELNVVPYLAGTGSNPIDLLLWLNKPATSTPDLPSVRFDPAFDFVRQEARFSAS